MIYEVYLNGLNYVEGWERRFKELLDCAKEEDKFIIIYTYEQEYKIKELVKDDKIVAYHSPTYFKNGNSMHYPPRLKFLILGKQKVSCHEY